MYEVAFWNPPKEEQNGTSGSDGDGGHTSGIVRKEIIPDVVAPARFKHEITIHQGRIERILEEDLLHYSQRGIQRSSRFHSFVLDEASDTEYPILVDYEVDSPQPDGSTKPEHRQVRTKYLVGADGAHSNVRRCMGLDLKGESKDHIWGVVDCVVDTSFPDIRRRCAINSAAGSVMVIPREQTSSGEYLTRLYVQMDDAPPEPEQDIAEAKDAPDAKTKARAKRAAISMESILRQANRVMQPYFVEPRPGSVDWWAAYQIGQRVTDKFSLSDGKGQERVFIVGDGKCSINLVLPSSRLPPHLQA